MTWPDVIALTAEVFAARAEPCLDKVRVTGVGS